MVINNKNRLRSDNKESASVFAVSEPMAPKGRNERKRSGGISKDFLPRFACTEQGSRQLPAS